MFALVYGERAAARRVAGHRRAHRRAGDQARRRALGRRQAPRRRPDLQPAHVRRPARRGARLRLGRLGHRDGRRPESGRRTRRAPARLPDRVRRAVGQRGPRGLEALGSLAADPRAAPSLLTDDLVAEDFDFYGRTLSGTEEIRDRWKRGVSVVEGLMGDARRQALRRAALPAGRQGPDGRAGRQPARGLPGQHQPAGLDDAARPGSARWPSWTSSRPKIGYPAKWRDYSTLVIDRDDLYGNYRRGYAVELRPRAGQARRPGRPRRVVHDAADGQRLLQPRHERDRLPRSDSAAAVLRRRRRRRRQLRRHRRGDRPRDRPRLRRPGRQVRRRRQPGGLVDRRRPRPSSVRAPRR